MFWWCLCFGFGFLLGVGFFFFIFFLLLPGFYLDNSKDLSFLIAKK